MNAKKSFEITELEWNTLHVKEYKTYRAMAPTDRWTELIASKISTVHPECVPVFKLNRVAKERSRKKKTYFWNVKAICKFKNCGVKFHCYVKKEPTLVRNVIRMKCKISGRYSHETDKTFARKCTGNTRKRLGKMASQRGPSETFHSLLGKMTDLSMLEI